MYDIWLRYCSKSLVDSKGQKKPDARESQWWAVKKYAIYRNPARKPSTPLVNVIRRIICTNGKELLI